MDGIYTLENQIQEYAWGSTTAISELLGQSSPSRVPQAELWMGAHPKAPSQVMTPAGPVDLDQFIKDRPTAVLGPETARIFDNRIPYLFKVLAAAKPLSIQAHPDLAQAREGYSRENAAGIDLKAPERNYRDDNHKPECICALTDFWALNGFRESSAIARNLSALCPNSLAELIAQSLPADAQNDLRLFFESLMTLSPETSQKAISEALTNLDRLPDSDMVHWMKALQNEYPFDIGVLSPAMLNLVCLQPGQAMYLPAGQLHAYLEGVGIELMANSDNVLRGGLTPKHVDVPELMRVLNFRPTRLEILVPEAVSPTEKVYRTPAQEFELSIVETDRGRPHIDPQRDSMQILLCTRGAAELSRETDSQDKITVGKGTCLLVKASADSFQIAGKATLYKAAVPQKS